MPSSQEHDMSFRGHLNKIYSSSFVRTKQVSNFGQKEVLVKKNQQNKPSESRNKYLSSSILLPVQLKNINIQAGTKGAEKNADEKESL